MQKITITGVPITGLRRAKSMGGNNVKVKSFDMREAGSPAAPKGLDRASELRFSIFVNEKQLRKAELSNENLRDSKLLIKGELITGLPHEDCPGDIGVIAFEIQVIEPKRNIENKEIKE